MTSMKEKKGPLRLVVIDGSMEELYECGHRAVRKSDIYGFTNAYKRRCRRCRDGVAPTPEDKAKADEIMRTLVCPVCRVLWTRPAQARDCCWQKKEARRTQLVRCSSGSTPKIRVGP